MIPAIGYSLRDENWLVVTDEASVSGVEIVLEPGVPRLAIRNLLGDHRFPYVNLRTQRLTVGGPEPSPQGDLDDLTELADAYGATSVSHQLTLPIDRVDAVCRHVSCLQRRLAPCPFYLGFTMGPDAPLGLGSSDDFRRVLAETGCGLTLDLTDVFVASIHGGQAPWDSIEPLIETASGIQLLLNGGSPTGDAWSWRQSAEDLVPEAVWGLYRDLLEAASDRVDAVFLTKDLNFPTEETWRSELRAARRWAELIVLSRAAANTREAALQLAR